MNAEGYACAWLDEAGGHSRHPGNIVDWNRSEDMEADGVKPSEVLTAAAYRLQRQSESSIMEALRLRGHEL